MKIKTHLIVSGLILASTLLSATASASFLTVSSYDMLNGDVGAYAYWDESYNGAGDVGVSQSPLTGGVGDLTNGIIASGPWGVTEPGSGVKGAVLGDNGPYVGWSNYNPFITFNFEDIVNVTRIVMHFDNSIKSGNVGGPNSISFNGATPLNNTVTRANKTTAALSFDVDITGNSLTTEIFRGAAWTFLSEVEFEGTIVQRANTDGNAVSAPATLTLLGLGLAGLGFSRRKSA